MLNGAHKIKREKVEFAIFREFVTNSWTCLEFGNVMWVDFTEGHDHTLTSSFLVILHFEVTGSYVWEDLESFINLRLIGKFVNNCFK